MVIWHSFTISHLVLLLFSFADCILADCVFMQSSFSVFILLLGPFLVFVVVLLLLVAEQLRCSLLQTVVFSIHAYSCSSLLRTVLLLLLFFLVVSAVSQLY